MDGLAALFRDTDLDSLEMFHPDDLLPPPRRERAGAAPGILYVEDFDDQPAPAPTSASAAVPAIIEPAFTGADLEGARAAGRQAGLDEARQEQQEIQAALRNAALATIGDALAASRAQAAGVAEQSANSTSLTILALLRTALPAASEALAGSELTALLRSVLPNLKREPRVELRLYPATIPALANDLAAIWQGPAACLVLTPDETLAPADVIVTWLDGECRRDTATLWQELRETLAPYALPSLQTILEGVDHG